MSILGTAVIAVLKISQWTGRRQDKTAASVAEIGGNAKRAGNYTKRLASKQALAGLDAVVGKIRAYHYLHTAAWADGERLLPSSKVTTYTDAMRVFRDVHAREVDALADNLDSIVEQARSELGDYFKASEFPTRAQLVSKCAFNVSLLPVPSSDDFRIGIGEDELANLRVQAEAEIACRMRESIADSCDRLLETSMHMYERLSDVDAVFRDSLVTRSREVVASVKEIATAFNAEDLVHVAANMEQLLAVDPQTLRDNAALRSQTANAARAASDMVRKFQGVC